MSVAAHCPRCREPLGPDGRCASCDPPKPPENLDEKLRRLREEVARERDARRPGEGGPPSTPRGASDGGAPAKDAARGSRSRDASPPPSSPRRPPATPRRSTASGALRAREIDLTDPRHGEEAVRELLEHRRRGLGRIVGLAGLPRHGKTKLADRLRERYAERPGADLRYDKTERGEVNLYYVPGRREHHVLVDVAGEDFQALGDYDRDLPALMRRFLWPVLQELDGLLLLLALPIVWAGWNRPDGGGAEGAPGRAEPSERDEIEMRQARQRMVDAHRMLLKYALVARDLKRIRKAMPQLELSETEAPTRDVIDDAFQTAGRLQIPVAVAFSKADLYAVGRPGLWTPPPPSGGRPGPPLHPLHTDPTLLAYVHFPELWDFLLERVRFFTFDFVQALVDRSEAPLPQEADEGQADASRETLLGAEGLFEFVTRHPWRVPGLGTRTALKLDRRLRPDRWTGDLFRGLHDRGDADGGGRR